MHSTEIMLGHDDDDAVTMTQYGALKSHSLATFDADISGSNVQFFTFSDLHHQQLSSSIDNS